MSSPEITKNHFQYYGLTEITFKDRLYNHKNSFKYESKRSSTELSNYLWEKKEKNGDMSLQWYIKNEDKPYSPA